METKKISGSIPFNIPILLILFNRTDKTKALIDALAVLKPSNLYIAADGPRENVPTDKNRCTEVRSIATNISWPCEIHTNFSEKNLGVDKAVETAISWFFDNAEEGIILEDDCIPSPDFFRFTDELLEKYRDNEQVMMISGNNFQNGIIRESGSYYFSRYPNIWGWATWRRAWKKYDTKLTELDQFIVDKDKSTIRPINEINHWVKYFKKLKKGIYTPWDAKWVFAIWNNDGLCIVPNVNLVKNIGFGKDATHTSHTEESPLIKTDELPETIVVPTNNLPDEEADRYLFETIFKVTFFKKLRYILDTLYAKTRSYISRN